ncbi:MAG: glycosyltransferase [Flavobacteriales bacterium]|nr:glycosyltransferase [Flavobacteriales bacterium]
MVSVIMPVYNGMPYLPKAVASILKQTFSDFEFIIIDDGSTDNSASYLRSVHDPRIKLINLPTNAGVTKALQRGLLHSKGKYIARLDADDLALPDRLAFQVQYMESHPDIVLMGSSYQLIDEEDNVIKYVNIAKKDLEIRWKLLFKNPFIHSTVIFRHSVLTKNNLGYRQAHGEDYRLWVDILEYGKAEISDKPLVKYRVHPNSWTTTKNDQQVKAAYEIASKEIRKYISIESGKIQPLISFARGIIIDENISSEVKRLYKNLLKSFLLKNHRHINMEILFNQLLEAKKRMGFKVIFTWWPDMIANLLIKRLNDRPQ